MKSLDKLLSDKAAQVAGKEHSCLCRRCKRPRFNSRVRKIPWRRVWQPTPVSLPGNFHEQRSLSGYSPWGHTELEMTARPHVHAIFLSIAHLKLFVLICYEKDRIVILYMRLYSFTLQIHSMCPSKHVCP